MKLVPWGANVETQSNKGRPLALFPSVPQRTCEGHAELLAQLKENTVAQNGALDAIEAQGKRIQTVEANVAKLMNLKYWLGGIVAVIELLKGHDPAVVIAQAVKQLFGG